ncbi:MAG: hypothetical protein ACTSV2_11485 [Candidatus Thorarchaeota archaeon]
MKNRKIIIFPLVLIIVISFCCLPVRATNPDDITYNEILEYDGVWNTMLNKAVEILSSGAYRCNLVFEYVSVPTDADDYWIEFHYNGVDPGWWWNTESLQVSFRWGRSGGFTNIILFDTNPYDGDKDITTASSSILQIKFRGCLEITDSSEHTWFFDSEPVLWYYYD